MKNSCKSIYPNEQGILQFLKQASPLLQQQESLIYEADVISGPGSRQLSHIDFKIFGCSL